MCIVAMYTTTYTRLIHKNNVVFLGLATLLVVVGVRLILLGFTRLVTLVTLVTIPLILVLLILGISIILLCKYVTLRGWWLHGQRMHGRLRC